MNAKQLIASAALLVTAGAAIAQSTESVSPSAGFVSTKTRAEVVAELNQAYAQGVLVQRDGADPVRSDSNRRSVAEVRQEAMRSMRANTPEADLYFGG